MTIKFDGPVKSPHNPICHSEELAMKNFNMLLFGNILSQPQIPHFVRDDV